MQALRNRKKHKFSANNAHLQLDVLHQFPLADLIVLFGSWGQFQPFAVVITVYTQN
jgi:hypothetical protein